jgi:hypothetical protein
MVVELEAFINTVMDPDGVRCHECNGKVKTKLFLSFIKVPPQVDA